MVADPVDHRAPSKIVLMTTFVAHCYRSPCLAQAGRSTKRLRRTLHGETTGEETSTHRFGGAIHSCVVAPADGVVTLAAENSFSLEGRLLMIDHGMGLNSAFLHCANHAVKEGEVVRQGQLIGRIGATGRATGPHLHWSIKWRECRLDPLLFVGA